jgi:uncharacterized protein (DUF1501 family)
MRITRRAFMKGGAMAVVGTAAIPSFLTRAAWGAAEAGSSHKRLVVIFQRGAADGLNIVVPHAERSYYAMRPSINIPRQQVIDLNGFFGLHPSLAPFKPLWDQRQLAIARHHALALRRAGLHGIRHARREDHQRWLAQSYVAVGVCR